MGFSGGLSSALFADNKKACEIFQVHHYIQFLFAVLDFLVKYCETFQ